MEEGVQRDQQSSLLGANVSQATLAVRQRLIMWVLLAVVVVLSIVFALTISLLVKDRDRRNPEVLVTSGAPTAIGPYSQGILAENLVFTAGQLGFDPATSQLAPGGIQNQTRQALTNVGAILEAGHSSFEKAVSCIVYLTDITNFSDMNSVYSTFFTSQFPARTTIAVTALPATGALVEISCIGVK